MAAKKLPVSRLTLSGFSKNSTFWSAEAANLSTISGSFCKNSLQQTWLASEHCCCFCAESSSSKTRKGHVEAGWQIPGSPRIVQVSSGKSSIWSEFFLGRSVRQFFLQCPQWPPPMMWLENSSTWKMNI